ncbi:hypothetical protein Ahy_B03g065304 [Arachis hypogaea]|uniref:Aminotransferase-like plant mobile domain-containing protein n=1 Tax=Arachis hypogaea TaxID=3818 RepID=A0A445A185_ARAHY|nr:hypothetical protein Ahy_B03g065304 [Arachis hypogaea]
MHGEFSINVDLGYSETCKTQVTFCSGEKNKNLQTCKMQAAIGLSNKTRVRNVACMLRGAVLSSIGLSKMQPGPQDHVLGKVNLAWVRWCRDSEPCNTQESVEQSLCRASRYKCKEMDGPLTLLFVWAWERMPLLAPIPRDQLGDVGIPLARWWSHWRRRTRYIWQPTAHFRRGLDDMGVDDFIWRSYMGVVIPDVLAAQMVMCSTQSPLVSFECIEWHPTNRIRRQFGMEQLPPGPACDLGRDHCKRVLRWYTQQYGMHLRLSDRVAGEEVGADEPHQQQEEPAGPQKQVLPHEQQFQVPAYEHQVQMPAYTQQFQDPAYAQQWPAYAQQQAAYIPEPQPPQAPEPYIPHLVIPVEGHFSPLGGFDTISFSQVLRDTDFLSSPPPQEGPATSRHSSGRRATSGHASDFDFDESTGHVDPPGPSPPPCDQLFDLNEYPHQEEGDLGYDLQHWYDLGGSSAPGMSGSDLYDTGGASVTDFCGPEVGSGLDAGLPQGRPYNLRTQTAPLDKHTPSLYSKKAPRKYLVAVDLVFSVVFRFVFSVICYI